MGRLHTHSPFAASHLQFAQAALTLFLPTLSLSGLWRVEAPLGHTTTRPSPVPYGHTE